MTVKLEVEKREEAAIATRKAGRVPGIVYGPKQEPIKLSVDAHTFNKTLQEAGEATIISLEGLGEELEVLIQEVSFDAARGGAEHVDFYAIERGKELTTNVPLEFIGEAPATKSGATVSRTVQDLEVTCRPRDLPSNIEGDQTMLVDEESLQLFQSKRYPDFWRESYGLEACTAGARFNWFLRPSYLCSRLGWS